MAKTEPDGTRQAQQPKRVPLRQLRVVIGARTQAGLSHWYYFFPKEVFFFGLMCGTTLMWLYNLYVSLTSTANIGVTSVPILTGISFFSSILGFVFGRYLSLLAVWVNSRIGRVFRIPLAPAFFEQVLAATNNNRVAILAGTLRWTEESSYRRALMLLDPDHRGTKEIYLFYKAGLHYKRANILEYGLTIKRVIKLMDECVLPKVFPNPGRFCEVEGCLSPDAFALVSHLFSKEEFQQIKNDWENRTPDKQGPEPCNDFVTVFRNHSLVKAMWDILDSYMAMDFLHTDPDVMKASHRVKSKLGMTVD